MKNLNVELKESFSNLNIGQCVKLDSLPDKTPGWVLMDSHETILVAIPCSQKLIFNENFAGIVMRTSVRKISDEEIPLLSIASDEYDSREQFAKICADFLDPKSRDEVAGNPSAWWERWKHLLGNKQGENRPYPVIGELLTWKTLLEAKVVATWSGPQGSTHDVESAQRSFEVKSTTDRTGATVTISSQHQLSVAQDKELFLVFNRFEPIAGNLSINSLAEDLVALGANSTELETQLGKLGFPRGRIARFKPYRLLESIVFRVDENFPKIVDESFKGNAFPDGVIKLIYDIDLANLQRKQLEQFIKEGWGQ